MWIWVKFVKEFASGRANPVSDRLHTPLKYRRGMKESRTYQDKREKCENPTHFYTNYIAGSEDDSKRTPQGERNDVVDLNNAF